MHATNSKAFLDFIASHNAAGAEDGRKGDWIETYKGRPFWPFDPRPEEIDIEDIAHALACLNRYTGHTRVPYSVAEHSVRVMQACDAIGAGISREILKQALLHDASEAYMNDIARPVKYVDIMHGYRRAEHTLQDAIFVRFKIPTAVHPLVREMDNVLLVTEARDLMRSRGKNWAKWIQDINPLPYHIRPWSWDEAESRFLVEVDRLGLT